MRQSLDVQEWSLSSGGRSNARILVGAILMIAGGLVLLGSLFLPWEWVDLQELFGGDVPSIAVTGFDTGIGKLAGVLALLAVAAGVIVLVLSPGRRRLTIALAGLGSGIGAGVLSAFELFADVASGTIVGLSGAVLVVTGGIVATAAAESSRGGSRLSASRR